MHTEYSDPTRVCVCVCEKYKCMMGNFRFDVIIISFR